MNGRARTVFRWVWGERSESEHSLLDDSQLPEDPPWYPGCILHPSPLWFSRVVNRNMTDIEIRRKTPTEAGADGKEMKRCVCQIHGTVGTGNVREIIRGDLSHTEELDLKLDCDCAIPHEPMMIELPGGRFFFIS